MVLFHFFLSLALRAFVAPFRPSSSSSSYSISSSSSSSSFSFSFVPLTLFVGSESILVFHIVSFWNARNLYRVLPGFTQFTQFYLVLPSFTRLYRVLLGFTGFYWVLLGFTGFYWILLGFVGMGSASTGAVLLNWNTWRKHFWRWLG